MNPKPFCILSRARSGTNMLVSKLRSTKKVFCALEPFNKTFDGFVNTQHFSVPEDVLRRMNDHGWRDREPYEYTDYILGFGGELNHAGISAVGFKIFPEHNADIFWKMSKDHRVNAIVLQRLDVLANFSSFKIALETSEWAKFAGDKKASEQHKIRFDPDEYRMFKAEQDGSFEKTLANLSANRVSHIHVTYEDLVGGASAFDAICNFLDLGRVDAPQSRYEKQNDANVLNRFINPEDAAPFVLKS